MVRARFVKRAAKDYPERGIKRGDSYWMWKFNFDQTVYMQKEKPRLSQLTRSRLVSRIYSVIDKIDDLSLRSFLSMHQLRDAVDEIIGDFLLLRSEIQSSLDRTPETLIDSFNASPIMLNRHLRTVESLIRKVKSIDVSFIDKEDLHDERERLVDALIQFSNLSYKEQEISYD